jgi:hypothetical protein
LEALAIIFDLAGEDVTSSEKRQKAIAYEQEEHRSSGVQEFRRIVRTYAPRLSLETGCGVWRVGCSKDLGIFTTPDTLSPTPYPNLDFSLHCVSPGDVPPERLYKVRAST